MSTTTIDRPTQILRIDDPIASPRTTLHKALLMSGIAASLFYVAANVFGALRWDAYSSVDWSISELFAVDAPSRPTFLAFSIPYGLLSLAFGIGVLWSARGDRRLRIAAWFLIGVGVVNQFGPFVPMHSREVIAAGGATLTDTLHISLTIVLSALFLLAMGFSAFSFGKGFRLYSIITVLTLIVFGMLTSLQADALQANDPTPWMGVYERINLAAYLLWMTVLAVILLRTNPPVQQAGPSSQMNGQFN